METTQPILIFLSIDRFNFSSGQPFRSLSFFKGSLFFHLHYSLKPALVQDPYGDFVRPKIMDNGDGTYVVTYTPSDVGRYQVSVKFGGQNVPSAPFYVMTSPTGDASKVKILGKKIASCGRMFLKLIRGLN